MWRLEIWRMSGIFTEHVAVNMSHLREFAFKANISPNRNVATPTLQAVVAVQ